MIGLGGTSGKFSTPRMRHATPGVTKASGTSSLTLSSSTPYLPFLGNPLVGLSFVPNAPLARHGYRCLCHGPAPPLRLQPGRRLVLPTATTPSATLITSLPAAQDYFHQLSGLTTTPDVFKNGCD